METKTIQKITDGVFQLGHLTQEVSKASIFANDVIEDGKRKAQRTVRRAYVKAQYFVEDTTYYIKRHPWQSVSIAAGFGVGTGLLASWRKMGRLNSKRWNVKPGRLSANDEGRICKSSSSFHIQRSELPS
jgi:ElaB/YqjD/DUF883 family membrane-anchored ribosome-binding protein